jgi:hypothetical protein
MFHNGGYAICDDALQHRGNMSNINIVTAERQVTPARAFHNNPQGGGLAFGRSTAEGPGGKNRGSEL